MSISGAVLSGLGSSSFLINGGKRSSVGGGAMRAGRKNVITAPQRKKSWVPTVVKGSSNTNNDPKWLDNASEKASEYVKEKGSEVGQVSAEKGQELQNHMERAKDYIFGKAGEAMDAVAENAKRASEFVTDKGKETKEEAASMTENAKDFIVEKAGDVKDSATDMKNKTAKYVGDKASEAKEAILPPKTDV
ncbi:PREDICTED: protein COLD-REGULATED 15B, chloroplastic-like [Camelina sativa]|uniref:Protein COLD-REGULATED 15B, chloroplastic-like n=1 Tax=Camelina sativa TaxID=90675 RepID=A0ABM0ZDA1_CAMSA|nr:PREDICTED: protein COLD-REGULATED 15B, chloroplastic-like [Camelina sativa]